MNKPFFSIIITSHNYGVFLSDAIKSVLSQSDNDFEIIGVDVSSNDNTLQIYKSFPEIKIASANPGSHADACFEGLKNAKGDWILFLDGDDFLNPEALFEIKKVVTSKIVKVQFKLELVNESKRSLGRVVPNFGIYTATNYISFLFKTSGSYPWPMTSGNCYKRDFLSLLFPLSRRIPVDGQINTVAPCFGRIITLNKTLGYYRIHKKSKSYTKLFPFHASLLSNQIKKRYKELFWARKVAKLHHKFFPKKNILNSEVSFLVYRLILRRLNFPYLLSNKDSCFYLFSNLFLCLFNFSLSKHYIFKNLVWMFFLFLTKKKKAYSKIQARFTKIYSL